MKERYETDYEEFDLSKENGETLRHFRFLFDINTYANNDCKSFRRKLKWLLNLLPLVKKKETKYLKRLDSIRQREN